MTSTSLADGTPVNPFEVDTEIVKSYVDSAEGRGCLRGAWTHDKSVSSAYWDPHGRRIVSTSYDDSIRCQFIFLFFFTGISF